MVEYIGLFFLIAWAINVWVFLGILAARPGIFRTCIWAAVLVFPIIGYLAWLVFGRKLSRR
ncbi:MAG: hypothetical protein ACR2O1_04485 [Boseongicola sp.]